MAILFLGLIPDSFSQSELKEVIIFVDPPNNNQFDIENEKPLIDVKLEKLISKGTITQQIQGAYKKSEQSLKSFIREN